MPELFSFSFMQRGLIGALITGGVCSFIGVFVVLRGMSYVGTGIAHGCLAGVALAFLMGWNPLFVSILAALIMVVLIEIVGRKAELKIDTAIGVIFSLAMACAVLFIGMLLCPLRSPVIFNFPGDTPDFFPVFRIGCPAKPVFIRHDGV